MDKRDKQYYKQINEAYIVHYTYDKDCNMLVFTTASGKETTILNPSELILTKVKCVYQSTGAKLKASKKLL